MKNVLVIDDEPAIRRALRRVLESAGYSVRVAENGAEGIDELKNLPIDIVIADIIMPHMHGVDAIKAIAREFPQVRIVAISGGGNFRPAEYKPHTIVTEAYLAAAMAAGAHAVLTKPFSTQDVMLAMSAACADSEGSRTLD